MEKIPESVLFLTELYSPLWGTCGSQPVNMGAYFHQNLRLVEEEYGWRAVSL